jgi:hypothetical protein
MCQSLAIVFLRVVQTYPFHTTDIRAAVQDVVPEGITLQRCQYLDSIESNDRMTDKMEIILKEVAVA